MAELVSEPGSPNPQSIALPLSYKSDDIGLGFMSKYITNMFLIPVEIDYSELNKNEGFFNQEFLKAL